MPLSTLLEIGLMTYIVLFHVFANKQNLHFNVNFKNILFSYLGVLEPFGAKNVKVSIGCKRCKKSIGKVITVYHKCIGSGGSGCLENILNNNTIHYL